jgi:hypothetical protein
MRFSKPGTDEKSRGLWPALNRREFLAGLLAPLLLSVEACSPRPKNEAVERLTPGPTPPVIVNHLGFPPKARKQVIVHVPETVSAVDFTVREISSQVTPIEFALPLNQTADDFGRHLVGDFSELEREGLYQIRVGSHRSVPFSLREDVWRRTLPKAVHYIRAQRCGAEVPGVHPVCHLDDARRSDTGEHVDVTGGWHDAGDLRKWMSSTLMTAFGLAWLLRFLGERWDPAGSGIEPILEEIRWGNRYFLAMQDADGLVWHDTAGGLNGDNGDNRWTDNEVGTDDDRTINPTKPGRVQAMFIALEATLFQTFQELDPAYARRCLEAALRCWKASSQGSGTGDVAWWTLAALELYRATGEERWADEAARLGGKLVLLQNTVFVGSQKLVRGFWRTAPGDPSPYTDVASWELPFHTDSTQLAIPPLVLLELAAALPGHAQAGRWRDAVRLHLDEFVLPMCSRSVYRIMPFGLFVGSPTPELYRPLAGRLTYRYFMPVRKQFWWIGTTAHLAGYAMTLARAARTFGEAAYRDLAYRQLEWVMGGNPFGACLMTGEGIRNPYPHSTFVGLIRGGIMNGIAGNASDEPILDTRNRLDWRTTEYWGLNSAHYIAAVSMLEAG